MKVGDDNEFPFVVLEGGDDEKLSPCNNAKRLYVKRSKEGKSRASLGEATFL